MNNQELDKWLAEKVMGWKYFSETSNMRSCWYDPKTNTYQIEDWYPTTNISQAFMCEDKIPENKRFDYICHLHDIVKYKAVQSLDIIWLEVHATAEQRCRTIHATFKEDK